MIEKTENFFTDSSLQDLSQSESSETNIKYQIYDFFGRLFKSSYKQGLSKEKQIVIDMIIKIIFFLQVNSLCWYSKMSIDNWNNYKFFWEFLGYFNIENLCECFDIFDICFYGAFAYVSYVIFIIITLGILKIYWNSSPKYIVLVSRKTIFPLISIVFIPILNILIVGFKELTNLQTKQVKYDTSSNLKNIYFGIYGAIICIIYIIIFFIFAIFYEIFTAELRHSNSRKNLKAKSNSELDILLIIFYGLTCILYYCFDENTKLYLQCFQAIFSTIFIYLFIKYMPYYNIYSNSVQACGLCSLSTTSLSFLFAEIIDDASITIIFFLFLQPILMLLAVRRIKWNWAHIQNYQINYQSDFELKIRNLLINYEDSKKDLIFEMFSKFSNDTNIKKSDLYAIWETNFCLYTLNDVRLARVKLLKIKNLFSTIEGGVQKWKIDKKIKNENLSDMRYIQYLQDFGRAKSYDRELCCILLILWEEITARSPRFTKLMDLMINVSDSVDNIIKLYESLSSNYRNVEVYDFYSSFLNNILGDSKEALAILNKKNAINIENVIKDYYKIDIFGSSTCVLLISLNKHSFGYITSMNEKMVQYLKVPTYKNAEYKFIDFIPWPYNNYHLEYLHKFYHACSTTFIPLPENFFIQDYQGYLLECKLSATVATSNDEAYVLLLLDPTKSSRQTVLLSENGIILTFTQMIPELLNTEKKKLLKGEFMSSYLPQFPEWSTHEPHFLLFNGRMLVFYFNPVNYMSSTLYILTIFHDSREIELIKKGISFENIIELSYKEKETLKEKEQEKDYLKADFKINTAIFGNEYDDDSNRSDNKILHSSQNLLINPAVDGKKISKKFVKNSEKALKIFKYVLIISIIAIVLTYVIILILVYLTVSHEVSLKTIKHLGDILFEISSYSTLVRTIDAEVADNLYNLNRDLGIFSQGISNLVELKGTLLTDYDQWSYCPSSKIMREESIPAWYFDAKKPYLKIHNLYNMIDEFISHGINLIAHVNSGENYSNELKFLIINSIEFSYKYISKALDGLLDCEINKISKSSQNIYILLILGTIISFTCTGIILYFAFFVERKYDEFWYNIRKNTLNIYEKLKETAIDRLVNTHGVLEIPQTRNQVGYKRGITIKKIKSKMLIKYSKKCMVIMVVSLSFYFLFLFYLYDRCLNDMENRPLLLSCFVYTRALISRMGFFARDASHQRTASYYPTLYGFENPTINLYETIENLEQKILEIRKKEYIAIMSANLKEQIFKKADSDEFVIKYGSLSGLNTVIIEAYLTGSSNNTNQLARTAFVNHYTLLQEIVGSQYEMADQDSKDAIYYELRLLIYIAGTYSIVLTLLFCIYYLPFLRKELEIVAKLRTLMTIVCSKIDQAVENSKFE